MESACAEARSAATGSWARDVAVRRGAAVGAVALDLARVGLADARRAGGRREHARTRRPALPRARRRGVLHAAPAGRRRAGERLEPDADRPHADRLRRRQSRCRACSPWPTAARRPGLRRLAGVAGSWYFGNNPAGRADVRPGHRRDLRRRLRRRRRSTATAAPSRRSTACSRCSRSTPRPTWPPRRAWRPRSRAYLAAARGRVRDARRRRGRRHPARGWTGESAWSGGVRDAAAGRQRQPSRRRASRGSCSRWRCAAPTAAAADALGPARHPLAHRRRPAGRLGDPGRARGADAQPPRARRVHRHAGLERHDRARRGALPAAARVAAPRRPDADALLRRPPAPGRAERARATTRPAAPTTVAAALVIPPGGFALG